MARITVHSDKAASFNPRWDKSDRRQLLAFLEGRGSASSPAD